MSKKPKEKSSEIQVYTEIDESLNIHDIKNDIVKCERLIRRSEYKIRLYKRKLNIARYFSQEKKITYKQRLRII